MHSTRDNTKIKAYDKEDEVIKYYYLTLKEIQIEFIRNNRLTIKSKRRFKSDKHNVFTEDVKKIALSANDSKTIQSISFIKTRAYIANKNLKFKNEVIKCNNMMKLYKKD